MISLIIIAAIAALFALFLAFSSEDFTEKLSLAGETIYVQLGTLFQQVAPSSLSFSPKPTRGSPMAILIAVFKRLFFMDTHLRTAHKGKRIGAALEAKNAHLDHLEALSIFNRGVFVLTIRMQQVIGLLLTAVTFGPYMGLAAIAPVAFSGGQEGKGFAFFQKEVLPGAMADIYDLTYSELQTAAGHAGVFEVGMTREDLADALIDAIEEDLDKTRHQSGLVSYSSQIWLRTLQQDDGNRSKALAATLSVGPHYRGPEVVAEAQKDAIKRSSEASISYQEDPKANGGYAPWFFEGTAFTRVESETIEDDGDGNINRALNDAKFSFAYLRDGELRTLSVYKNVDGEERRVESGDFTAFLEEVGIEVEGADDAMDAAARFKAGKYLSRIFRGTKQDRSFHIDSVDVRVNTAMVEEHGPRANDGLSLVSPEFMRRIGAPEDIIVEDGSGQFTLFYEEGMVKGHYLVKEGIDGDVILYGKEDNLKTEIKRLGNPYTTFIPGKTSKKAALDVQTTANLAYLFGEEQLVSWARVAIKDAFGRIRKGEIGEWMTDLQGDPEVEIGGWRLKQLVERGFDFTQIPRLVRDAWKMFMSEIQEDGGNWRIPIPGGRAAYVRTDRRDVDAEGNYVPRVEEGEAHVDDKGNFFVHPKDAQDWLHDVHGGSDEDDRFVFVPLTDGRSVVYRSPNQFGEASILNVTYETEPERMAYVTGELMERPELVRTEETEEKEEDASLFGGLGEVGDFLDSMADEGFTPLGLLDTWGMLSGNSQLTSLGEAALASRSRAAALTRSTTKEGKAEQDEFLASTPFDTWDEMREHFYSPQFRWDLERIIDASQKDGDVDALKEEGAKVDAFWTEAEDMGLPFPEAVGRATKDYDVPTAEHSPIDVVNHDISTMVSQAKDVLFGGLEGYKPKWFVELESSNGSARKIAKGLHTRFGRAFDESDVDLDPAEDDEEAQEAASAEYERIFSIVRQELAKMDYRMRVEVVRHLAYRCYDKTGPSDIASDAIFLIPDKREKVEIRGTEHSGRILERGTSRYFIRAMQEDGRCERWAQPEAQTDDLVDALGDALFGDLPEPTAREELLSAKEASSEGYELTSDPKPAPASKQSGDRVWLPKKEGGEFVPMLAEDSRFLFVTEESAFLVFDEAAQMEVNLGSKTELSEGTYRLVSVVGTTKTSATLLLEEEDVAAQMIA